MRMTASRFRSPMWGIYRIQGRGVRSLPHPPRGSPLIVLLYFGFGSLRAVPQKEARASRRARARQGVAFSNGPVNVKHGIAAHSPFFASTRRDR